ncbi:3-dehydroquinate dehydratase [Pyxidicoccus parkwayensis]|uniref:3-dehydroquinate dehydratase n=1 Tax=Pyxidicoccus parkwayensis TaxID=2813578 RepID=A0ABX7NQX3_9BACT|nr:type II 3-dehydroquinate dehydratase [Pyxidicoccus parkwaysis]QSQ19801.1 3-dehydroquinate dehydratase [Pyxidicoccus parkwaysis]
MRLLVLHGPNLNLLGAREGTSGRGLADLDAALKRRAEELELELKVVQSNHEGVLLDTLAAEREEVDGVLINPAGFFGSYALKEALELVGLPAIEVLLRPPGRESVVGEACVLQVHGTQGGFEPYLQALETFASGVFTPEQAGPKKSLGRKKDAPAPQAAAKPAPVKSLGRDKDEPAPVKSLGRGTDEPSSGKSLGRGTDEPGSRPSPVALVKSVSAPAKSLARTAEAGGTTKTLGRKVSALQEAAEARPGKTLGRGSKSATPASDLLTRALVRQKISDRLAGKLSPAELAAWARTQFQAVQRGAPAESGHRELLEESLQSLTLSTMPASRLSDEQLVDMLTRLDEG